MTIDYQVRLIDFPNKKTHEYVTQNEDGTYTIFIDAALDSDRQREEFNHALRHIASHDFEKCNVNQIECVAHK